MEEEAKNIEVSAPTVEEAIAKGLAELGKAEDEVEIEVLNPGSRGVLGIGAKEALVRLSFVELEEEAPTLEESVEQVARETLQELLVKMGVKAQVSIRPEEETPQDEDAPPFILDIMGDDLGVLIGRRGQNVRLASQLTGLDIDIMTEAEESERRQKEFGERSAMFMETMNLDEMVAQLLVSEGFATLEEVAYVDIDELLAIDGFDEDTALRLAWCGHDETTHPG